MSTESDELDELVTYAHAIQVMSHYEIGTSFQVRVPGHDAVPPRFDKMLRAAAGEFGFGLKRKGNAYLVVTKTGRRMPKRGAS